MRSFQDSIYIYEQEHIGRFSNLRQCTFNSFLFSVFKENISKHHKSVILIRATCFLITKLSCQGNSTLSVPTYTKTNAKEMPYPNVSDLHYLNNYTYFLFSVCYSPLNLSSRDSILVKTRTKSKSSRPEVFCKKGVLLNFAKRPETLSKKRLWHRCFPVNFAKLIRTHFLTEHLRWLLLKVQLTFILECCTDWITDDKFYII